MRLLLICLVGLTGAAGEDAGNTWGALYLTGSLGTTAAVGGAVFVAMQTTMIIGRFAGDPLVTRFGPREVSRVGGVLTVLGFAVVMAVPTALAAVVGFAVVGLGIAVLIPLAMQAADELPGLPRGFGLAVSGWMMRVGFLLTPPLVGIVADEVGLRWAFAVPAVLGLLAICCAGLLAPAERRDSVADLWYAAYGSNLARDRFENYLSGGRPVGATRHYPGARDSSPPIDDRPLLLAGRLFFAWESPTWGGGIAFYDPDGEGTVYARAYRITAEQFSDLAAQEMRRDPGCRARPEPGARAAPALVRPRSLRDPAPGR